MVLGIKKNLKFEAEGQEFAKILKSLEHFFLTVDQNNFSNKIPFSKKQLQIENPEFVKTCDETRT